MKLPIDESKYTAQFKYVEFAGFNKTNNTLLRYKNNNKPELMTWDKVYELCKKYDYEGVYTSVFQYNNEDYDKAQRISSLFFDIDNKNDLEASYQDVVKLYEYIKQHVPDSAISVYFTGLKGFHLECEFIALGVNQSDNLAGIFRFIAKSLSESLDIQNFDFQVYDSRRMWRIPNTFNIKGELFKVECKHLLYQGLKYIMEYAKKSHPIDIPEQVFDIKANRWYRDFALDYEMSLKPKKPDMDLIARFLEQGSSLRHVGSQERVFDKYKLLKNCPAVAGLEVKARTKHFLDHYERLFLCSLLTYTDEAIQYLHEILAQCSDYNFEISNSHIEDWIARRERDIGGRPFTCAKSADIGIVCSGCANIEPRKKLISLNGGFIESEETASPSPVRFSYSTKREF